MGNLRESCEEADDVHAKPLDRAVEITSDRNDIYGWYPTSARVLKIRNLNVYQDPNSIIQF